MKNIALIGCGRISVRHAEAIAAHPDLRISSVYDIVHSKSEMLAEKTGARAASHPFDVKDADVVSILTPSGLHPAHTINYAENTEVPIILTEKPISLTIREALELYERVEKAGKCFLPVYQNRYNPLIAHLRSLVVSGKLGHVYQFICNVLWNRNDSYFSIDWHGTKSLDGGILYTQASHYIDMLHFFFGELEFCQGVGTKRRQLEVNDTMAVIMRFKNGTVGTLNASVNTYEKNFGTELTLIAEKGTIHVRGTNLNTIDHWNVEGMDKPELDFHLSHEYGRGHNAMYAHIHAENWQAFPSREDVLSGIAMMERLSY